MLLKKSADNSIKRPMIRGRTMEKSVKPYHLKFINAGVSTPIVIESLKGQSITIIKAMPCTGGYFPRVDILAPQEYLPVCENKHCRCSNTAKFTREQSFDEAILEWNKYRYISSSKDLYHPTVKVNHLPLKEIKLNLAVEQMFIDGFLAKFSRNHLTADDRWVFILREKWLDVLQYQLNNLSLK